MHEKELIFFDTEFTSLDPYKGEILSIGMVKENGEELYIELECDAADNRGRFSFNLIFSLFHNKKWPRVQQGHC